MSSPKFSEMIQSGVTAISKKFEDVDRDTTQMIQNALETGSTKDKIEAVKILVEETSRGVDHSDFFPGVVKNVITESLELKKLVYIYLVHYASQQQELALLSINAFQKDMTNENQLNRAMALKVMSSIRVPMIVQLVVLAVRKAVQDRSPYVKKTAALAAIKVYELDKDQKDELIPFIQSLFANSDSTMVLGATVEAFNQICPDRWDVIHPHYRKLCQHLRDMSEWGHISTLSMMLRYVRSNFLDPNKQVEQAPDVDNDNASEDSHSEEKDRNVLDPDHGLLLRASQPLFHSRNAAVVLAVSSLYFHAAPEHEMVRVGKAMARLIRNESEMEYVVLQNAVTVSQKFPHVFEPFLRTLFITGSDAHFCRDLKLEILTHIANSTNIGTILREFQAYVKHNDPKFVASTIRAIGQCAIRVPEVTSSCMQGLLLLMKSKQSLVVSESVIVIKKLLQVNPTDHDDAIASLARVVDDIHVPLARASIIWVIGEYFDRMPDVAPDVLRKMAKSFIQEDDIVKLQILNLAAKLYGQNVQPFETISLLFQYVLSQAQFDLDYDIRDRARFIKAMVLRNEGKDALQVESQKVMLPTKPAPSLASPGADRGKFTVSSMSHLVNHTLPQYQPLDPWPEVQPDPSVREVAEKVSEFPEDLEEGSFYSTSGSSYTGSGSFYSESGSEYSGSYTGSEYSESDTGSEYDYSDADDKGKEKTKPTKTTYAKETPTPGWDSLQELASPPNKKSESHQKNSEPTQPTSLLDDLSMLDMSGGTRLEPNMMQPATSTTTSSVQPSQHITAAQGVRKHNLLSHTNGGGLEVQYTFTRRASLFGDAMNHISFHLRNRGGVALKGIHLKKFEECGVEALPFQEIPEINPGQSLDADININFNMKSQEIKFDVCTDHGTYPAKLTPPVGELVTASTIAMSEFENLKAKLGGLNAKARPLPISARNPLYNSPQAVTNSVILAANLAVITSRIVENGNAIYFAGKTLSETSVPVIVEVLCEPEVIMVNWSDLRVVDLKKELKKRGLSCTGKKAVLAERLTEDDKNKEVEEESVKESEEISEPEQIVDKSVEKASEDAPKDTFEKSNELPDTKGSDDAIDETTESPYKISEGNESKEIEDAHTDNKEEEVKDTEPIQLENDDHPEEVEKEEAESVKAEQNEDIVMNEKEEIVEPLSSLSGDSKVVNDSLDESTDKKRKSTESDSDSSKRQDIEPRKRARVRKWGVSKKPYDFEEDIVVSSELLNDIPAAIEIDEEEPILEEDIENDEQKASPPSKPDGSDQSEQSDVEKESLHEAEKESLHEAEPDESENMTLLIQGFKRPFTLGDAKEYLTQCGEIAEERFWMNKIRTHCYVTYETKDQALGTLKAVDGKIWPQPHGPVLKAKLVSRTEADVGISSGELPVSKQAAPEKGTSRIFTGAMSEAQDLTVRGRHIEKLDAQEAKHSGKHETSPPVEEKAEMEVDEEPVPTLDELFRKTEALPHVYWLPRAKVDE